MSERKDNITIEVFQQDFMPGWAAFHNDGSMKREAKAHVSLNVGGLLAAVHTGELDRRKLPYMVAESLVHEAIHAFEAWAEVEFSEEKVEALLTQYRERFGRPTVWRANIARVAGQQPVTPNHVATAMRITPRQITGATRFLVPNERK